MWHFCSTWDIPSPLPGTCLFCCCWAQQCHGQRVVTVWFEVLHLRCLPGSPAVLRNSVGAGAGWDRLCSTCYSPQASLWVSWVTGEHRLRWTEVLLLQLGFFPPWLLPCPPPHWAWGKAQQLVSHQSCSHVLEEGLLQCCAASLHDGGDGDTLHRDPVSFSHDGAARSMQGVSITSPLISQHLPVQKPSHRCFSSQRTTPSSYCKPFSIGVPQHLFHLVCQGNVGYSLGQILRGDLVSLYSWFFLSG